MEVVHLLCDINGSCLSRMKCLKLNDLRNSLYYLLYESFFSFLEECSNCAICFAHLSNIIYIRIYFNTYLHCQSRFIKNGGGGKNYHRRVLKFPLFYHVNQEIQNWKIQDNIFSKFQKVFCCFLPFFYAYKLHFLNF